MADTFDEATTSLQIGWIGTGRMGSALVERLLDAGHSVSLYNRTREKAVPLEAHGAKLVDRPVDLAGCDLVGTTVSGSADLERVLIGPDGLLDDDARSPRFVVDFSTVSAQASAAVREAAGVRGSRFLAAPVSGNPGVAATGKLAIAVSGSRDDFDAVEPVLRSLGQTVAYVGDGEAARLVKIGHNVLLGVITQTLAEVLVLAEKGGVSRGAFMDFVNSSVVGSVFTGYKTAAFTDLDFRATFTLPLLRKDFDIAIGASRDLDVPLPVTSMTRDIIAQEVGEGNTEQDFASLILRVARGAGVQLEPAPPG